MEALRELSFWGRLSSIVRTPYIELNRTSSGSSSGSSFGIEAAVDIWFQVSAAVTVCIGRTFAACPDTAGFSILALRGIIGVRDREIQLSGFNADVQRGRKNINGSNVVIVMDKKT